MRSVGLALNKREWSYAAIARHVGRDWRTVKAYLMVTASRGSPAVDAGSVGAVCRTCGRGSLRIRTCGPQWASALFDEVVALGYEQSYPGCVRQVRQRVLRPHCEACWGVKSREHADIDHPPDEEIQWGWFERRRAPCVEWKVNRRGTRIDSRRMANTQAADNDPGDDPDDGGVRGAVLGVGVRITVAPTVLGVGLLLTA